MTYKRLLTFKNFLLLSAVISVTHFSFFLLSPNTKIETKEWNQEACLLQKSNFHLSTTQCRYWYTRSKFISQAVQPIDEVPECVIQSERPELYARLLQEQKAIKENCLNSAPSIWGAGESKHPEIGWDAVGIWYARASVLYLQNVRYENSEGILSKAFSVDFLETYSNREHSHYPPLVSVIYASFMKAWDSADPVYLQILQFAVLLAVICLFWKTQGHHSSTRWQGVRFSLFAFLPINAVFAYTLYADLWIIFGLLAGLALIQRRVFCLASLILCLIPFIKAEGWFVLFATLATLKLLDRKSFPLWMLIPPALTTIAYLFLLQANLKDADFYISVTERLFNIEESFEVAIKIAGYYLDVLFRPKLWGLLWPLSFALLWANRKQLGLAVLPLALSLLAIPVAFWTFPFGHKEIVLTGSNRALWQLTPMLWILWNSLKPEKQASVLEQTKAL